MKSVTKISGLLASFFLTVAAGQAPGSEYTINGSSYLTKITGSDNYDYSLSVLSPGGQLIVDTNIYNARNNNLLSTDRQFVSTTQNQRKDFSVFLPFKNRINGDGLKVELIYTFKSSSLTTSGIIYPYNKQTLNAKLNHQETIFIRNQFFNVTNFQIVTDEYFNFVDTIDYLSVGNKSNLDFSEIHFRFNNNLKFNYYRAEFHIKDYKNVYPDLIKVAGEVTVQLKCIQKGGVISFATDDNLYVNKETLQMASYPKAGYEATDEIFVPIGAMNLLEENECYILIREAGYSCSEIIIPLTFYSDRNYLGDCYMSDYCIVGGVKQ